MNNQDTTSIVKPRRRRRWLWYLGIGFLFLVIWQIVARVTPVPAPLAAAAAVTDQVYEAVYDEAIAEQAAKLPKEVNILVVGLDNRIASNDNHADAIHLISVRTKDSVAVEITSIPRGTEVKGYGIADEFAFMANVRALKGRKTFMKAVSKLTGKKINYYVEVTFSQVMGVLELLGYKDPATALQFLRHRKTYALGDIQRSYTQGKFIRTQMIRRGDLLTGAKGDLMIRMGLGMVDTDLDFETVRALVYVIKNANALDDQHITQTMRPKINLARLDSIEIPEPNEVATVVNKLVRRTGDEIDDLGRYNPYPRLREIVSRAEAQKNPRAVIAILEPVYEQKAWLQVQERPQRREIRDKVEDMIVSAYTAAKKPEKAAAVKKYMNEERQAFSETEREHRSFSYGRRNVPRKERTEKLDPVAAQRAKQDDIRQKQTHIEPQEPTVVVPVAPENGGGEPTVIEAPKSDAPSVKEEPKKEKPASEQEPKVENVRPE